MHRILIYRLGSLGDTCVVLPALRVVRHRYPQAKITFLTNLPVNVKAAPAVALLEGTGLVDDYLAYPVGTRSPFVLARLAWQLRQRGYDLVVNLAAWRGTNSLRRDKLFFQISGAKSLAGFAVTEAGEIRSEENGAVEREAERMLRRVGSLGSADLSDPHLWGLELREAERAKARERLASAGLDGDFIAISVGAKVSAKDWTQPNWLAFIERLGRTYPKFGCVIVGSGDEMARADECLQRWPGFSVNLCGKMAPRESAAVLSFARLFIGHDSGPMHLAACVGTPCVGIFAARNPPGQWFPFGSTHSILYHKTECYNCGLSECILQAKKCILSITVDEVLEATRTQLSKEKVAT